MEPNNENFITVAPPNDSMLVRNRGSSIMLDGMSDTDGYAISPDIAGTSFLPAMQHTLKNTIHCTGIGLHSGEDIHLCLHPAEAGTGIVFKRTDPVDGNPVIPALYSKVSDTRLCSTISNEDGVSVATVEHLMSALSGCGVDNALVEVSGPEVPVMDGSAEPFVFLIDCAGLEQQITPRQYIKVLRRVEVEENGNRASIEPSDRLSIELTIDFAHAVIGRQSLRVDVSQDLFKTDISRARTFGLLEEVETMRKMGLARGGSLENAVVVGDDAIVNAEGLRYDDEFVRHKILDCVGDLALAGLPLLGAVSAYRTGHALNNKLLRALFSDSANWTLWTDESVNQVFLTAAE